MEIPDAVLKEALLVAGGDLEKVRRWWTSAIPEMGGASPEHLPN